MRDDMSDAARESASRWLTQLWSAYVDDVAANRQIEIKTLTPSMEQFVAQLKEVNGDLAALSKKSVSSMNWRLVSKFAKR